MIFRGQTARALFSGSLLIVLPLTFLLMMMSETDFAQDRAPNYTGQMPDLPGRPKPVRLWEGDAPHAQGTEDVDIPQMAIYPAPEDKATGAAIVVCPGGGYRILADHEGHGYAVWLNSLGITVAVLKYRLGTRYQHPAMLSDVARAIRTLRAKAADYKIDPARIGVMGSSAGGHLASTAATHFDEGALTAEDPIERVSSRPDLAILCYPVITLTEPHLHRGSRDSLIGKNPDSALIDLLSNEKQVTEKTPPTFIFHTADDAAVPVENALLFAEACRRHKVPVELHVYESGKHGVGLAQDNPVLRTWPDLLKAWLDTRGFLSKPRVSEIRARPARAKEIEDLLAEARLTPPEFAADAILRVVESGKVTDLAWKQELLEEAFQTAAKSVRKVSAVFSSSSFAMRLRSFNGKPVRLYTNITGKSGLDALSLQCRAVSQMLSLNKQQARSMFQQIPAPELPVMNCQERTEPDVAPWFETCKQVIREAYSGEEMASDAHLSFVSERLRKLKSPFQVHHAASLVQGISPDNETLEKLLSAYIEGLSHVTGDVRAMDIETSSGRPLRNFWTLFRRCRINRLPADELLKAYRGLLVRNYQMTRCEWKAASARETPELPGSVKVFNDRLIAEYRDEVAPIKIIAQDEIAGASPELLSSKDEITASSQMSQVLRKFQEIFYLRMNPQQLSAGMTEEEAQQVFAEFIESLERWSRDSDLPAALYFQQKNQIYALVTRYFPLRREVESLKLSYVNFLGQYRLFCETERNPETYMEWFDSAYTLIRTFENARGEKLSARALEEVEALADSTLRFYLRLDRLLPKKSASDAMVSR